MFRIGHGIDVHRFGGPGPVTLGGVKIPCDRGLVAHSDGDVLLHALADGILGAAGLGDIGRLYPDTDDRFRGIDSRIILRDAARRAAERGFRVVNADLTVLAEAPKIAPHAERMRANIAEDLGIGPDRVNVKATTTEKLGFTGRGEGIAAEAAVLLEMQHAPV